MDNVESKSDKKLASPSVATDNDHKKLASIDRCKTAESNPPTIKSKDKQCGEQADKTTLPKQKLQPSKIKSMGDREKIAAYRKNKLDSLADNRNAIFRRNEGNPDNQRLTKMNSHNYDKLAQARGLSPEDSKDTKESFAKWHPDSKNDPSLRNNSVLARHANKGEKVRVAGNKPSEGSRPSGVYVAKGYPNSPEKIVKDYALPSEDKEKGISGNTAKEVANVELAKNQNILVGQVAPQRQWETDGIPRNGGARQIVTDGGYRQGAIRNIPKDKE